MPLEYKFYNCPFLKLSLIFHTPLPLFNSSQDFCVLEDAFLQDPNKDIIEVLVLLHKELTQRNAGTILIFFFSSKNPLSHFSFCV